MSVGTHSYQQFPQQVSWKLMQYKICILLEDWCSYKLLLEQKKLINFVSFRLTPNYHNNVSHSWDRLVMQKSYSNLALGCVPDGGFGRQNNCAVLQNLKFTLLQLSVFTLMSWDLRMVCRVRTIQKTSQIWMIVTTRNLLHVEEAHNLFRTWFNITCKINQIWMTANTKT